MQPTPFAYLKLRLFCVIFLISCASKMVFAFEASQNKTFAVFVATYNPKTHEAHGGVAGTAFFTSEHQALTAYHVLQAASFETMQVWLVHEGEPAIELKLEDVRFQPERDMTLIDLRSTRHVTKKFIFQMEAAELPNQTVQTDGFLASSSGPVLLAAGNRLLITAVPALARIHAEGVLVRKSDIDLQSADVNLKKAPCLQLSYRPVVGLSGGPVISNGKVIAMNSFADPSARVNTWAVEFAKKP